MAISFSYFIRSVCYFFSPPSLEGENNIRMKDEEVLLEERNRRDLLQPAFFLSLSFFKLVFWMHSHILLIFLAVLRYALTPLSTCCIPRCPAASVFPCAGPSLLHSSTHLHQLHHGHKICQRDLTPDDKSLVLQKPLLKLLQGSGKPLHNLLEFLRGQWLPCEEGNQHLRRKGI